MDRCTEIPTKLPLVYVKENQIQILPFLDLKRIPELWGICVERLVWGKPKKVVYRLTHEAVDDNRSAECLVANKFVGQRPLVIPKSRYLEAAYTARSEFGATISLLKSYKIEAENWSGLYLTNEPKVVFTFRGGRIIEADYRRRGHLRLAVVL